MILIKLNIILISLFLFVIFCDRKSKFDHGFFRYDEFEYIPMENIRLLKLGFDSHAVAKKLSYHVYQEITYKDNFLPRRINGVFYPVNHINVFFGTKSSKIEFKLNGKEISKTRTKEGQSVTLFFIEIFSSIIQSINISF